MEIPSFLHPQDVMKILDYKPAAAYRAIQRLNEELEAKGLKYRPGRVSTKYFCERYGIEPETLDLGERSESA